MRILGWFLAAVLAAMSVGVLVLGASLVYALGDEYGFGTGLLGVAAFAIGVAAIPALIARWVFAKTRAS